MNFGEALTLLRSGSKVKRSEWDQKEYVFMHDKFLLKQSLYPGADEGTFIDLIHFWSPEGGARELLAQDWEISKEA